LRGRESADVVDDVTEQVAERRERELRLGAGRSRRKNPEAARLREFDTGAPQRRLPDPGLSLEEQPLRPVSGGLDKPVDLREFALSSDELGDPFRLRHAIQVFRTPPATTSLATIDPLAEQHEKSLSGQLGEIESRLAWVRDYL